MNNEGFIKVSGFCMKCKERQDMIDVEVKLVKTAKGKKRIAHGKCIKCSTKMAKILKNPLS